MTDLRDLLERASNPTTTDHTPLADDLARGQVALRRRRAGMTGGVLAAAVALSAVGGLAVGWAGSTDRVSPASSTSPCVPSASAGPITPGAKSIEAGVFCSWPRPVAPAPRVATPPVPTFAGSNGKAPFTLGYVPEGWKVQGWSGSVVLDLVHSDGQPNTVVESYRGKIVVSSRRTLPPGHAASRTLNGRTFLIGQSAQDGSWTVTEVRKGSNGGHLTVQGTPGVSAAEMVEIAANCRMNPSALVAPDID